MKKIGVRKENREGVDVDKVYLCHCPLVQAATMCMGTKPLLSLRTSTEILSPTCNHQRQAGKDDLIML